MKNLKLILIPLVVLIVIALVIAAVSLSKKRPSVSVAKEDASSASSLYSQANALFDESEFLKAKDAYKTILTEYPDFKELAKIEDKLQDVNMKILFSPTETPQTTIYEVKSGDSLAKIAKNFNTTVELLKKSNNLSSDIIKVGKPLRIWSGKFSCVVDKSLNTLTLKSNDEVLKVYRVATGANNHTPVGTYQIINKLVNPVWYFDGKAIPPESPENILGTRWMGFNQPFSDYGIHGTTDPDSIGKQATQGCVRMLNSDVEELYSILPVGTEIVIID